jgi:nucleoside-diphosphate-sugar epimerase
MELHVVVGAGPVGTAAARLLAEAGHRVRVVTRSGSGPQEAELITADASDQVRMAGLTQGATAIYNCANPSYDRWPTDWPPIAGALLAAAERSGAVLASVGNLYGYGPVGAPISESTPLRPTSAKAEVRVRLWQEALAAHEAGRIRTTEVRGSDYLGAGARTMFTEAVLPAVMAGRTAFVPGDPDAPHSWTYTGDVARLLVTAAASDRAWGRAWHVPTAPPVSVRELAAMAVAGAKVRRAPSWLVRAAGVVSADLREVKHVLYQFDRPFVIDSSAATATFGLAAAPLADSLAETVSGRSPLDVRPGR